MGRLFGYENGSRLPKRRRKRGKVAQTVARDSTATNSNLRNSPNSTGKYMVVHESETILGKSSSTATPLFWICDLTDEALLELINKLPTSPDNFTEIANAAEWALQNDFMIVSPGGTSGLPGGDMVLYFDPSKIDCYPGTGNVLYDLSGNGNDATLYNSPEFINGCIEWNGTNEYAQIAFNSNMANWATTQTIAMWLKHDYTSGRRNPWDQAYGGYGTWTHEHGNNINNYFGDAGRNAQPYTSGNSSTTVRNKWNLLVTTRNTSQQKWYNNATHVSTRSHSYGTLATDTNVVRLARGYAGYWDGKMGPVIAYDRVLTQDEVTSLYYGGPIVTNNLVLNLDASILSSYEQGETSAYNLDPSEWNVATTITGSLKNGVGWSKFGGGSWEFDGSNDYIVLNDNLISAVGGISSATEYTLEAWIYVRSSQGTTTNADSIIGHTSATGFGMQVGVSGGKPRINYGARSTSNFYSNTFEYNEWKHVVLARKASNPECQTYLDGKLDVSSGASLYITSPSDGTLNIGHSGGRVTGYYDGYIAVVRVYSDYLTADEVEQNYEAQRARFGK